MAKQYVTIQSDERPPANAADALVSVILPIYNAEAFLDQALRSIREQTHRNLEIICVNDGSTDGSLGIMREHAAEDDRVRVINKKNEGYGASCNRGLDEAHGEWIAVVEPDDWIEPGMYADMLEFASGYLQRIDIVKTPYWRVLNPDTRWEQRLNCPFKKRIRQSKRPFRIEECPELLRHHPCIWSAIYRRSFLEKKGIRFQPIPGAGWADNPFLIETLCQAKAIVYLDQAYYCYREETREKTADFHVKQWRVPFERWNDMQDVLDRLGVTDKGVLSAHVKRGFMYMGGVLEYNKVEDDPEIDEAVRAMFERMDPEIVFAEPDVEPGQKRLFAEVRGIDCPDLNEPGYRMHVMRLGLYALRNVGVKQSTLAASHYLGTKRRRAAGR